MNNHILPSVESDKKPASKARKNQKESKPKFNNPHVIIPQEDLNWALKQQPAVYFLWGECWRADPYGSRMMQLNTTLPRSTFMRAKKVLSEAGLFIFNRKTSTRDSRETVCWEVQNLHGARVKDYWEKLDPDKSLEIESHERDCKSHEQDVVSRKQDVVSRQRDSICSETLTQQESCNPSVTSQEHLSNSSEELLGCEPIVCSENLISHLEAARTGIKPPNHVIEQLRDSNYWDGFRATANVHGWDLSEYYKSTISPETQEKLAGTMRSLKERHKYKIPKK